MTWAELVLELIGVVDAWIVVEVVDPLVAPLVDDALDEVLAVSSPELLDAAEVDECPE